MKAFWVCVLGKVCLHCFAPLEGLQCNSDCLSSICVYVYMLVEPDNKQWGLVICCLLPPLLDCLTGCCLSISTVCTSLFVLLCQLPFLSYWPFNWVSVFSEVDQYTYTQNSQFYLFKNKQFYSPSDTHLIHREHFMRNL